MKRIDSAGGRGPIGGYSAAGSWLTAGQIYNLRLPLFSGCIVMLTFWYLTDLTKTPHKIFKLSIKL